MKFSDKKVARKEFLQKRLSLTEEKRLKTDTALCRTIIELEEFKNCDTVLLYHPTRNEADLLEVAKTALSLKKRVAFPISLVDTCTLDFRLVAALEELSASTYGICEPPCSASKAVFTESTLCIVPALAYDVRGYRLGYGKGYYDRFLKNFKGVSLGAINADFLCKELPINDTDIAVNIVITETGVIYTK